jgi:hypothetical protein
VNPEIARFCRHCGLPLVAGPLGPGGLRHPEPLPAPEGYGPFENAPDLHFCWEATWGGPALLGTEGLTLTLFNAGYGLRAAQVRIRGLDEAGTAVFDCNRELARWPRGAQVKIELASWELSAPVQRLVAIFVAAELDSDD